MRSTRRNRVLSLILCGTLVFGQLGTTAYAEVGTNYRGGLCKHHPVHDEACGYVEGHACEHEHTDECYKLVTECIYIEDDVSDNEATPSDAKKSKHVCTEESGCITEVLDCQHVHDDSCGFVEAKPCQYDCEICNPKDNDPVDDDMVDNAPPKEPEQKCICTELCNGEAGQINEDCPVCGVEGADLTACQGEPVEDSLTEKIITGWKWIDPDEMLTDGGLALPGVNPDNQADFDTVVSMLPKKIKAFMAETATGSNASQPVEITLTGWTCDTYKQDDTGAWPVQGDYTFTASLPEGYALSDEAASLEIKVTLGGANTLEETGTGDFTVTGGTQGTDYTYANNTLTILKGTALTISGTTTSGKIVVDTSCTGENAANITLDGLDIQFSDGNYSTPGTCAFEVAGSASCNLTLTGTNILKSGRNRAGLQVESKDGNTATLTIAESSIGSLTATGGIVGGAGIGGSFDGTGGTIIIHGGTVTAKGGNYGNDGAGIGGGTGGAGGSITITGGTVTATSGTAAAGIGGGNEGEGGSITITGGTVTATGKGGAGIGGGEKGAGGIITITGGTVTAVSNYGYGAGIGGGFDGAGGIITISGGAVTANATSIDANGGAGIGGGGASGAGGTITISGGTVTATGNTNGGAGIGGGKGKRGNGGAGGTITISGGTVKATGGNDGAGIGNGGSGDSGTFSTTKDGQNGNALILASSISDKTNQTNWSGIIFDGNNGKVYGDQTLSVNLEIPSGTTLEIPANTTLTIDNGVTLTNNGTINNYGTINGTVSGTAVKNFITYLDSTGREQTHDSYTLVQSSGNTWGADDSAEHWYVVDGNVEISRRITVTGNVHLILKDNASLKATQGIKVQDNDNDINNGSTNELTIYAQSTDESTMGKLTAKGGENQAGIGSGNKGAGGTITINGGNVTATGGYTGAGIGGGDGAGGTITISGGTVTTTGGSYGAGIGAGGGGKDGTITINGGNVTATGGSYGASIGGSYGAGGTITISGGTVAAIGGYNGAGIGGIGGGAGYTITISGGTVTATGGTYGAGIGGGDGAGGTITISGGTVTATGSSYGAGIGGGTYGAGGTITISGGTVTATGSSYGAGIGSGNGGQSGTFSTTKDGQKGNALIIANSISDKTNQTTWSGIIFEGNNGKVYGDQTLSVDLEIPSGKTLEIPANTTLTIGSGVTLTNNGIILNYGTLSGIVGGNGTMQSPSTVGIKFFKDNSEVTSLSYDDAITITANASIAQLSNTLLRGAAVNQVDFWLGSVGTGKKLGTAAVTNGSASLTMDATAWAAGGTSWNIGSNTITADFGGTTGTSGLMANTATATLTVNKADQTTPSAPTQSGNAMSTSITISTVSGQKYLCTTVSGTPSAESGDWKDGNGTPLTFNNLIQNTTYYIWTYIPATDYYKASSVSSSLSVTTGKSDDQKAVENAKTIIEGSTYTIAQAKANTESDVKTALANQITNLTGMSDTGVTVTADNITIASGFKPATAGNTSNRNGENGSFSFTVSLTKSQATVITDSKSGIITATPYKAPDITTVSLPDGKVGSAYIAKLEATGDAPISWSIMGSLPGGLTLSGDTISGTPTASGDFTFTVQASNSYTPNAEKTLTITITRLADSTGGSSNSGSSSSDRANNKTTTAPSSVKPAAPTTGEIAAKPGEPLTSSQIKNALDQAAATSKANGLKNNGLAVAVTLPSSAASVTLNRDALNELINSGVKSFKVNFGGAVSMTFSIDNLKEIVRQSSGAVTFTADKAAVTGYALAAIGTRPAYDLSISCQQNGQTVKLSSIGSVAVSLFYTPGSNEQDGTLYAVYADGGMAVWLDQSSYDRSIKAVLFTAEHFSIYGIGYKAPPVFTDTVGHWAKSDIDFVAARGLLSGTTATTFSPNMSMTREMFVMALGRLAGINPADYVSSSRFTDVPTTEYYAPYVEWAASKGIVNGTGSQTFEPGRNVTREEMAAIMQRYAKMQGYTLPVAHEAENFTDAGQTGTDFRAAVQAIQQAGIMNGRDGHRFGPKDSATRAEAAAVLRRYVEIVIDPATAEGWTQNDSGAWLYYQNGKRVTGWKQVESRWYYFDAAGLMQAGGWRQIGGKWYYFNSTGIMAVNTKIDGCEVGPDGARL